MPYVKKNARKRLDLDRLSYSAPTSAGELNYRITKEILCYLSYLNYNKLVKSKKMSAVNNYADYNEIMGVLECIKQELYRRAIAPYEDQKIKENGDVYGKEED